MGKMEDYDERFSDSSLIRRSYNFDKRLSKCSPMRLDFENLEYVTNDLGSPTGRKEILKKINGNFKSNELIAILGASGSGKTTLLNILAGLFCDGYTGTISFNEKPRDMSTFKKLSCYLTQEDYLRPLLTVSESMEFAANLKLDPKIKCNQKKRIIEEIILELGLTTCCDTRTECLSGGQRKRVSLALELINNPPVIFLDEPTTGMDCVSATKCIDIVKKLCLQGRMIICSIHQPSKYIFDEFDQVYFLGEGRCIYNGSPSNLVKYLSKMNFICPLSWNPADYLIEIAQEESILLTLQEGSKNGKLDDFQYSSVSFQEEKEQTNPENILDFPISCFRQIKILLFITFLQMYRNKKMLFIQFINHLLLGLVTGGLFLNSNRTASKAVENFFFYLTVVMFFIYTHTMTSVLLFPTEVDLFRKEHSNRWYSLRAYYGALILRNVPIMVLYGFIFNGLVYILTAQRLDLYYFGLFSFTTFAISAASEALGTFVGSVFSIMHGSIAAPVILAPFVMLSLYGIGDGKRIHPFMDLVTSFSYVRSGFTALCRLMLSNQPPLECLDEDYCHYKDTDLLLRDMGMGDKQYHLEIVYICLFTFVCRVLGYLALKLRTKVDFEKKIKEIISSPALKKFTIFCK